MKIQHTINISKLEKLTEVIQFIVYGKYSIKKLYAWFWSNINLNTGINIPILKDSNNMDKNKRKH